MKRIAKLFLVKPAEGKSVSFFLLLFSLIGAGLAVGKGSADALFLKRYGVEYFPYVYMVLSVALAVSSITYAAYVDRVSSERFFRMMFMVKVFILLATSAIIYGVDNDLIFPAYYIIYAIVSELMLVHCAMYIGQNFTTLQAKRLTPLIFAGYQVGMMAGGFILVAGVPVFGLNNAPLVWAGIVLVAMAMLMVRHRAGPSPYYFSAARRSRSKLKAAFEDIAEGFHYVRGSAMLRNASYALFFVVIIYYLQSFSVHSIYTEAFEDEQKLAAFFGWLVIATNAFAMLIQLLLSNRIINHFGVRKANYIYPVTTISSFLLLLFNPSFYAALLMSVNRETIMPAIYNPTRQLFFNVLPERMKGRARAISVALVMPVAMFSCGVLILVLRQVEGLEPVALAGFICALIFLFFAWRMGKDYIVTLIASMRERLYLPRSRELIYRDSGREVIATMRQGLDDEDIDVSLCYARALQESYPAESLTMILERIRALDISSADRMLNLIELPGPEYIGAMEQLADDVAETADGHLQATIFDIIIAVDENKREQKVAHALNTDNPRLQVCAIHAVYAYGLEVYREAALNTWLNLLAACQNSHMAVLRLVSVIDRLDASMQTQIRHAYMSVLPAMLQDECRRIAVLELLQTFDSDLDVAIREQITRYLDADDPRLRQAATGLLDKLGNGDAYLRLLWRMLSDGHAGVRQAAIDNFCRDREQAGDYIYRMLLDKRQGSPRACRVLLDRLISLGASNVMLEDIIRDKAGYAASLLCAIDKMDAGASDSRELLHIAMQERLAQTSDLILQCIEPMSGSSQLSVVRAGLRTQDDYHIANAVEALENITSHRVVEMVTSLIKGDCKKVSASAMGRPFNSERDALVWCLEAGDSWLKQCCEQVMKSDGERVSYA